MADSVMMGSGSLNSGSVNISFNFCYLQSASLAKQHQLYFIIIIIMGWSPRLEDQQNIYAL